MEAGECEESQVVVRPPKRSRSNPAVLPLWSLLWRPFNAAHDSLAGELFDWPWWTLIRAHILRLILTLGLPSRCFYLLALIAHLFVANALDRRAYDNERRLVMSVFLVVSAVEAVSLADGFQLPGRRAQIYCARVRPLGSQNPRNLGGCLMSWLRNYFVSLLC